MENPVSRYYRCPPQFVRIETESPLSAADGYFRVGPDVIGFGRYSGREPSPRPEGDLPDAQVDIRCANGAIRLPFDPGKVAENLRCELYVEDWRGTLPLSLLAQLYYFVRPILPIAIRRHLQKLHLSVRSANAFPHWPVDSSVDDMFGQILLSALKSQNLKEIPFVWFWPEGAPSAAFITHDVETALGRDYCATLMDIDDSFGIKASFQVIPEQRYAITGDFLGLIRSRGFEVGIHDLNHDGHLYRSREQFLERAARINAYGVEFEAEGFRAAVLYRKQLWYDALKFAFDMSVPNVATYDPQRGGCCTVMPYFIGDILELPVTMSQDYTLFNILGDYSIDIWRRQIEMLVSKNGLISCIVHPDYISGTRERDVYKQLLAYIIRLKEEEGLWVATPKAVNRWWRAREGMTLVQKSGEWCIEGPESDRARIAFAREENGRLVYGIQANSKSHQASLQ